MKIRPDDIEVPRDAPFRHDLLGRETTIRNLTNLLQNRESPYTMSIDASWGNGKTTFLKMWTQHLKNEGFPVVSFNAWESDFTRNPFGVLSANLLESLSQYEEQKKVNLSNLRTATRNLKHALAAIHFAGFVALAGSYWSILSSEPIYGFTTSVFIWAVSAFQNLKRVFAPRPDVKTTVKSFRDELESIAKCTSKIHNRRPLVIAIDELDRCRPSFAIELLEIAKHFFTVDNIVFVLAIDKTQLTHAINAIYGSNFDSIGYLRRFIDLDLRLPKPEQTDFVDQTLLDAEVLLNIERFKQDYVSLNSVVRGMLTSFLGASPLSLRQIQQAIIRLGLALASIESGVARSFPAFALIVFLRAIDPDIYHKFVQSEINDIDVSDYVFGLPGLSELRLTDMGASFVAILILADIEFRKGVRESPTQPHSRLYETYRSIASSDTDSPQKSHAEFVLRVFNKYQREHQNAITAPFVGFRAAANHIELFYNILPDDSA